MISPVFPRIQLNDTEKATSTRVPPRSKSMALCDEQLSTIPSPYGFPPMSSIQGYDRHEKNNRQMKPAEPRAFANCTTSFQPPWVPSYRNLDLKQQARRNQPDHYFSVRSIRTPDSCNVRKQTDQLCTGSSSDINVDCLEHKARLFEESSLAEASGSNSLACSSSVIITPDHVMNVMGEKQFWLTRRAMIDQQRMFAVQVFELHRLVQVQRLTARSPDLLLDDKVDFYTPSIKPVKKLQHSTGIEVGEHSPRAATPDHNGPPPGTLQAGNQWLVPVISPSEGLVYKPYSGTLSASGFMALPFYAECGAAMNPPYGMVMLAPVANSPPPHDHRSTRFVAPGSVLSKEDVSSIPSRSSASSNMSSTVMMKVQSGGGNNDDNAVLSLFPLEPTKNNVETCDASKMDRMNRDQQRLIKVIPRNPRLATESAAKIFNLIQEERKRNFNLTLRIEEKK